MEAEVKIECYMQALRLVSKSGSISPLKTPSLEELRKKFGITAEEHLAIEGRLLWELQHKPRPAIIMVIDDEAEFRNSLQMGLAEEGYQVLTAESPEEGLEELEKNVPDLILCDIQFPKSSLDGFSVYQKLRKKREYVAVPFIFVTGMDDEWVVRQGLQVGVDDYITKPFTMTTLLAAIEGKLQRYEELKKTMK